MKKLIALLLITTHVLISCRKNHLKPISEDYLITRSLLFYLRDSLTEKNLIGKSGENYDADSIRITLGSENGKTILDSNNQYYSGIIYLFITATKEEDINNIYIDLPVFIYLNQFDTDTIEIKKDFYQQIKFFYNGKFLDSIPALNQEIPILTIKK